MNIVKNILLNYIDPDGTQPKQAIRTALAGIIAMFLYEYNGWQQGYWIILSAVLMLQINFGDTLPQKLSSMAITGCATAIGILLVSILGQHIIILSLFLALISFINIYLGIFGLNVIYPASLVNLFCIISAGIKSNLDGGIERFLMIIIGTAIALILYSLLWPESIKKTLFKTLSSALLRMQELNEFMTYANFSPHTKHSIDQEDQLSERRNRVLRALQNARSLLQVMITKQLISPTEAEQLEELICQLARLYEAIHALERLCDRMMTSATTYEKLTREISILSARINILLQETSSSLCFEHFRLDIDKLLHTIDSFEKSYQRKLPDLNDKELITLALYTDTLKRIHTIFADLATIRINHYASE